MKRLRIISIVPIVLTLASCKPELMDKRIPRAIASGIPASKILNDTAFIGLIQSHISFYRAITNPGRIREIMKDNKITALEYQVYPSLFGFANALDFERYFLLLKYRRKWLDEKYGWKNLPVSEQTGYLLEGCRRAFARSPVMAALSLVENCVDQKNDCILSTTAKAVTMHLACAALDITIVAGIVCHSAAAIYQLAESNKCEDKYRACKGTIVN